METPLNITALNDFIFCPISLYFHNMYDGVDRNLFQDIYQLNGTKAHEAVDEGKYSTSAAVLQGLEVYCDRYNLIGKIDIFNKKTGLLVSYDISNNKLRTRFAKDLMKFGFRLQYSLFQIENSPHIIKNVTAMIENKYSSEFEQSDSVLVITLNTQCNIVKYGYAKNEETDIFII